MYEELSADFEFIEKELKRGKNRPPDHFKSISADRVKVLLFCQLHNLAHSGEGWSILLVSPVYFAFCSKIYRILLIINDCEQHFKI
jgi:hypothetical protein